MGDYILLNCEQVASVLSPLCIAPKTEVLRAMSGMKLSQNVTGMALRREDQLERKVEELRKQDEELIKVVARNNKLEASSKVKEDKLELSNGVMAENANLQEKVVSLTTELSAKAVEVEGLKGELSVGSDKLAAAISGTTSLENALRVCRSELTEKKEASNRKVAGLEGRIKKLEAELSTLNGQVASLRTEDVSQYSHPYTSHASADLVVPRRLYELWVHTEARLNVYKAFHIEVRETEAKL
ncbi:uncharacterized protein [Nicotiana sylvestris]|uniref:uncharacterized protein n=1 Tax=Nicotiana sylvestris TaxID=4096 RepID=UPI00388CDBA9